MINYIEYLNLPTKIAIILITLFFVVQLVGELLEFKGKVVPEYLKIRKYFARKRKEREIIDQAPEIIKELQDTLNDFRSRYNKDNIQKRNDWIYSVEASLKENDKSIKELIQMMDKNNKDTLSIIVENKRNAIIDFARRAIDKNSAITREEFNRILRTYKSYEETIKENGMTNGEVDIAYRIITESYKEHMENSTFVEDLRGYDV